MFGVCYVLQNGWANIDDILNKKCTLIHHVKR